MVEKLVKESIEKLRSGVQAAVGTDTVQNLYSLLPDDAQRDIARNVAATFVYLKQPTDLAQWADQFGEGPARLAAISGGLSEIAQGHGNEAAQKALDTLSGSDRDAGLEGLALRWYGPEQLTYATGISDPARREDTEYAALSSWWGNDQGRCRAWLQTHANELSAAVAAEWLAKTK